jgi:hypothetical protein
MDNVALYIAATAAAEMYELQARTVHIERQRSALLIQN